MEANLAGTIRSTPYGLPPTASSIPVADATRSPARPNPIGISTVRLIGIDGTTIAIEDVDMVDGTPLKRLGQPDDIALCALYLASPAASFVTGKVFEVDGGLEEANLALNLPDL